MTIGWPHEGMWTRRLSPEAEAAEIRRLAGARALNALRHGSACSCPACRVWRMTLRQSLVGVRS
jgi:hypothetical protein